jgi:hypothetical protein
LIDATNKNSKEITHEKFVKIIYDYCNVVKQGLFNRWKLFSLDLSRVEFFEVVGGLLSRQANLTIQLAKNPGIWNPHIAPLLFRTQIDTYITLAWILENDSLKRSQNYILYGLGQEKLQIEHLQSSLDGHAAEEEQNVTRAFIELRKRWLNDQLFDFLTVVDVGSWSGKSTREMAEEADCLDLYNYAYSPFSSSAHSMWTHIARHDLKKCRNPMHKKHRMPYINEKFDFSFDDLINSAKYLQKAYCLVDKKLKLCCHTPLPKNYLLKKLREI